MKKMLSVLCVLVMLFVGCSAEKPTQMPAPVSTADDIVILFTNDVHCGIEDDIGYAGLAAYKAAMEDKTPYVSLVDCGDAIQGDFIGTISDGEYIIDIMNEVGYDVATLGNHEFDYGMQQLNTLIEEAEYPYVACNITYSGSGDNALTAVKPYEIIEYGDTSVGFIGVITPESLTKSTPVYFMENGEYVYSFGTSGEGLYATVQTTVDECRAAGADYVVVLSHLGDMLESSPYTSVELIGNTNGIDAVLDGHAHNVIPCRIEKNKNGEDVPFSSTGTKLDNIGQLVITENGTVTVGIVSGYEQKDAAVEAYIASIKASYETQMNEIVATTDISLSGYDDDGIRLVRNRETTIGNFCADAYRIMGRADIGLINGGGIRDDLPAGEVTYADVLAVHPFGNTLCVAKATGQEILDNLEVAYRDTAAEYVADGQAVGENGTFQHISGMKLTIDTAVESSVVFDENGMLVSVGDTRRVKDVMILGDDGTYAPIDPNAEYTVASHNYLIRESGGGINVFADNELVIAEGMSDYQILLEYITDTLGGKLGEKYAVTEGRITIE